MSVETINRDLSTDTTSDAVKVKDAGEGAAKVKNPFDSWLPTFATPDDYEAAFPAKEKAATTGGTTKSAQKLIDRAKQFVGTPYKWGGSSPLGFDCSGFTQYLYRELGIDLPRISYQQASSGPRISLDQLKPGDLVAWDNSSRNNGADHIAVYIGNGQVIEAPKPGASVRIASMNGRGGTAWGVAMNL